MRRRGELRVVTCAGARQGAKFGVVVAVVALGLGLALPAHGAGAVERQAWTRTSGVPTFVAQPGRLYVASTAGMEEARAFVRVDAEALVAGAALVLREAAGESAGLQPGALVACPLTSPLVASGELTLDAAPAADCSSPVPVVVRAGTWTVALERVLAREPVLGVALVPVVDGGATFHVALDPAATTLRVPAAAAPPTTLVEASAADLPVVETFVDVPAAVESPRTPDPTIVTSTARAPAAAPAAAQETASTRDAATPSGPVVVVLAFVAALALVATRRRRVGAVVLLVVLAAPMLLSEAAVYKVGLVLIFFVAAIGLQLLVNWTGELSLAHAALVGLPAFAVAAISGGRGISPVVLVPVALLIGAVVGLVIGLPAVRARGLQVALVTLASGVAIDRFFFTKEWLVGSGAGASVAVPTLGPLTFSSARSLYPVLATFIALAVASAVALHRSKVGRALLWIKARPEGAAAAGIPVARYRTAAYGLAGAYAGFAGGLTSLWVQHLTPAAFPPGRSFTYLIVVALAGPGSVAGVAGAATIVEGGRLFLPNADALLAYGAPVGLLLTLTTYRFGLNGLGATARGLVSRKEPAVPMSPDTVTVTDRPRWTARPLLPVGAATVVAGLAAIAVAWYHAGNTSQVWVQNQELLSGGVGGLALVVVGAVLLVCDQLAASRRADDARWTLLLDAVNAGAAVPDDVPAAPRRRRAAA